MIIKFFTVDSAMGQYFNFFERLKCSFVSPQPIIIISLFILNAYFKILLVRTKFLG